MMYLLILQLEQMLHRRSHFNLEPEISREPNKTPDTVAAISVAAVFSHQ